MTVLTLVLQFEYQTQWYFLVVACDHFLTATTSERQIKVSKEYKVKLFEKQIRLTLQRLDHSVE